MNKVNEVKNSKKNSFGNILYANFFCMNCGEAFSSPFFHFVINLAKCPECGNKNSKLVCLSNQTPALSM